MFGLFSLSYYGYIEELLLQNIVFSAVLCQFLSSDLLRVDFLLSTYGPGLVQFYCDFSINCSSTFTIFCPLLSLSASLSALWIVVIRFQQVRDFGDHGKANIVSIVLGFISSVGISVTGNFQVTTHKNK